MAEVQRWDMSAELVEDKYGGMNPEVLPDPNHTGCYTLYDDHVADKAAAVELMEAERDLYKTAFEVEEQRLAKILTLNRQLQHVLEPVVQERDRLRKAIHLMCANLGNADASKGIRLALTTGKQALSPEVKP